MNLLIYKLQNPWIRLLSDLKHAIMRFLDFCTRIHALKTSTNVMIMLNDDLILSMSAPCMQAMLVATQALIHIIDTSSYDVSAFATRPMTWPGIGLTWLESGPLFWVWLASSGIGHWTQAVSLYFVWPLILTFGWLWLLYWPLTRGEFPRGHILLNCSHKFLLDFVSSFEASKSIN